MAPTMRATLLSIVLATVGACSSGGGGGGGSAAPSVVPFTSFGAIAPNQIVIMNGTAVTVSGTQTVAVNGDVAITSANINPVGGATVSLGYDGSRTLSQVSINAPQGSVSFDRNVPGHSVSCSGGACGVQNPTAGGGIIDASFVGWNYQTFGVWGVGTSPTSFVSGAFSAGRPTSGNAVPTTGNAVFTGLAVGFFSDSGGTLFGTGAVMSANVSFDARSIVFSTSNTTLINANTNAQSTDLGLNLSGTFSYAQGVNAFSGTLNTANLQLTGQGSGQFYGPFAEEMGGVYSLSGAGLSRVWGGFGGKR